MKIALDKGYMEITSDVLTAIIGSAASSCFGVKGMAPVRTSDGIVKLLRRESISSGVRVTENADGTLSAELHIVVKHGVNISAVCSSIIRAVRYVVEDLTGIRVSSVDVRVDSIMTD